MRLKSIEMQGFKSFADKIYLDFNSGITAIVGPNGSGKSNISDAIRWVMGEQSVKSLRGSKMEDVIFSGTEARKPLGFAEVTLTLDNTDGYFDLEFPEVSVTRRVYRSGEGEYYINKTLCRLKDVHELFMDTGLGRDGYSIIGQGKIDSILSTKSEDRRQVFEEAAGISKYKYRKAEAERKLTQTVENLTRVKDILSELEGQIGPLERQSEKARKYLVLRDEMRGLDISVSIVDVDRIKAELEKLTADLGVLNSQIEDISRELSETDEKISAMYDQMRDADEEVLMYSEKERNIITRISEGEKNIGILQNDAEHNNGNIERLKIEIEAVLENIKLSEKELEGHKNRLSELNREADTNKTESDEVSALLERSGQSAGEKNIALESLKTQIIDITSELNSLRGAIDNLKILSDSFGKRKRDIEEELASRDAEGDRIGQSLKQAEEEERKCKAELSEAEIEYRKTENELKTEKENIEKMNGERNKSLLELSQKRSRRTMLMDMEREFEGYAKGVKSVMTAFNKGELKSKNIYGPLAQLIKTDKKYILAIETALGAAGQNIVTESEREAKEAIAYLKEKHLGRATFLPVAAIKPKKFEMQSAKSSKGYVAVAADLIECDKKYNDIVSNLLGTTVICDDIDNAVSMAKISGHKFRIVTLGGDVIQPGGAMTGGSAVKSTGSLSRTGEIDALGKEIEKLKAISEDCENRLAASREKLAVYEAAMADKSERLSSLRADCIRLKAEREHYAVLMENAKQSRGQLRTEVDEITKRLAEIESESSEKTARIEEKQNERVRIETDAAKTQTEYSELSGENERLSGRLTELNIRRTAILKDIELENERISTINDSKAEQLESINIKRGGIDTLKERNKTIEEDIAKIKSDGEALATEAEDCRRLTDELNDKRRETERLIRKLQDDIKGTQEQKFSLSQQASKTETRIERLTADRENIINRIWEDYELTYSDAAEMNADEDFDYKVASERIRELKAQIKSLGNINLDSIEEYKSVKERFDFLTVQTEDLEKAKAELDGVVNEMMQIMQSRFAEQFKIINTNFNRVFSELFGGGRANLSLTEPDNVLESGIEIEAQPPGKKLQSLLLLSGGERAFTAIALLFAILDVRPTPFCILDEIEAALDDVNVYRYADYLKKYSQKTQFIVVTHRRGTMEAANILYGVTMQERGVSKLLSLNIDEVKDAK